MRNLVAGLEHVPIKSNRNLLSILWFGRIFCAEPVSTSAENALPAPLGDLGLGARNAAILPRV